MHERFGSVTHLRFDSPGIAKYDGQAKELGFSREKVKPFRLGDLE